MRFAYERPYDLGISRLGETEVQPSPKPPIENFVLISFKALGTASGRPMFWFLVFTFAVCGISSFGITQAHLAPFCSDLGLTLSISAALLALIGVFDLFGTIGSGWLSDRFDNLSLLVFYYLFRGLALVWLVSSNPSTSALVIFAVFYGLDFIATVPPTVKLTIKEFGDEYGPVVFAWIFTAHHIAAGLMLVLAGISRDLIGTYVPAFAIAGILCVLAAGILLVPRLSKVAHVT